MAVPPTEVLCDNEDASPFFYLLGDDFEKSTALYDVAVRFAPVTVRDSPWHLFEIDKQIFPAGWTFEVYESDFEVD